MLKPHACRALGWLVVGVMLPGMLSACKSTSTATTEADVLPPTQAGDLPVQFPGDRPRADWPTIVFEVPRGGVRSEPAWLFRQDLGGADADVRDEPAVRQRLLLALEP